MQEYCAEFRVNVKRHDAVTRLWAPSSKYAVTGKESIYPLAAQRVMPAHVMLSNA